MGVSEVALGNQDKLIAAEHFTRQPPRKNLYIYSANNFFFFLQAKTTPTLSFLPH